MPRLYFIENDPKMLQMADILIHMAYATMLFYVTPSGLGHAKLELNIVLDDANENPHKVTTSADHGCTI